MNHARNDYLENRNSAEFQKKFDERVNQGQSLQQNGKFHEAINEYSFALKKEPNSVFVLTQLALLTYETKDFTKSLEYSNKAIKFGCNSHLIWYLKGAIHLKFNETEVAVTYFEKALTLLPDFYPAIVDMTSCLLKNSNDQPRIQKACEFSYLGLKTHLDKDLSIKVIDGKIQIPMFRLKHDLEQARYLKKIELESATSKILVKQVAGILGKQTHGSSGLVNLSTKEYANLKSYYQEIIKLEPIKLKNYLNPNLDWDDIENSYLYKNTVVSG